MNEVVKNQVVLRSLKAVFMQLQLAVVDYYFLSCALKVELAAFVYLQIATNDRYDIYPRHTRDIFN